MSEKIAKVKYLKMAFIFLPNPNLFARLSQKADSSHQKDQCVETEVATTEGNHVMIDVIIFNAPFLEVTLKVE